MKKDSGTTSEFENCLFHKVGNTLYEISVHTSDKANKTAEEILVQIVASEICKEWEEQHDEKPG